MARALSGIVGFALVGHLVRNAGPSRVLQLFDEAAWWLPVVFALELVQMATDVGALRWLLQGEAGRVPAWTWIRSSAAAYALMTLLPAGRAAGEVTRGALLARHVGVSWAATAGTQLQASYLFGNGTISAAACLIVASSPRSGSVLPLLLAANAVVMWAVSAGVLAVLRGDRAGRWIERIRQRFSASAAASPALEPSARRRLPWRAAVTCTLGRGVQVVEYGLLLAAVGGHANPRNAFIAEGIHLVGSTMGDALPNQLGVVDGTYRAFAAILGFADAPARALAIALLAHTVQLSCALAFIVVVTLTGQPPFLREEGQASSHAAGHS